MEMKPLIGRSKDMMMGGSAVEGKVKRNKSSPRQQERQNMEEDSAPKRGGGMDVHNTQSKKIMGGGFR